jgi:protocatechuate 3,4-dioxygenase beta subunit
MPLLSGTVHDPEGRPVAGARVLFTSAPAALPDIAALTGKDGAFTLSAPQPGPYELAVHADGFAPAKARCTLTAAAGKPLLVSLRR